MKIQLLEVAKDELDEAVEYYNREAPGLGADFLAEILNALGRIEKYPEAWHPLSKRTRRCRTRRFPYGIIYQIRSDEILVIAIANLHRKPNFWQNRTSRL